MSETTFENAKVGDRCYSNIFGGIAKTNAVIVRIEIYGKHPLSITIKPDLHTGHYYFSEKGEYIIDGGQSLFWENPIKEIPGRPKRKVNKIGYMKIFESDSNDPTRIALTSNLYIYVEDIPITGRKEIKTIPIEFEVEE